MATNANRSIPVTTYRRALGIALAAWYLAVASYALHFTVDRCTSAPPMTSAFADGCGAHHCCCGTAAQCHERCCCDGRTTAKRAAARPSRPAPPAPAGRSFLGELACSGDAPSPFHDLPSLPPALLPEAEVVLPPHGAGECGQARPSGALRVAARAPDKVPIATRNG